MSFAAPWWLLLLLLVPAALVLYVWVQGRRSKYAIRFTNLELLSNVVSESPRWRRHVPAAMLLVALSLLLMAVARPEREFKVPREQATVILVMDVSGSMNAEDVEPTRLVAAQEAAIRFIDDIPDGFRVGVVSFAQTAQVVLPPTHDREIAHDAILRLRAVGGTAMGDALALAVEAGRSPEEFGAEPTPEPAPSADGTPVDIPPTVLLLLSDGTNTTGVADPISAARRANELGVKVFTVALGTPTGYVDVRDQAGIPRRILVPPDEFTLERVAEITEGEFFSALSGDELNRVYENLSSQLGTDIETREVTAWFAGFAAAFLLASAGLSLAWFNRFP